MQFINFLPFFIPAAIIFYLLPLKWRWVWLLAVSYGLYSLIDVRFSITLFIFTLSTFLIAQKIESAPDPKRKSRWLLIGLVSMITLLVLFKYYKYFFEPINSMIATAGLSWEFRGADLFFPIGISFFSLQIISYLLDVFYGKIHAESNLGFYALYVSFFPKLLMGPIERYDHLRPQFENIKPFNYQDLLDSLVRIGWGLFKKIVIADRLAVVVNTVFGAPQDFYSTHLIYAIFAFSFQIYIDFSAYCDIAIGVAKILGIDLVENFNFPYFAKSVVDFWRRWHISFSTWLRDYVFLTLNIQHRRKKPLQLWITLDIMLTFLISGLWHGENWTFLIWGAIHGFYQAFEINTQKLRDRIVSKFAIDRTTFAHKTFQVTVTFLLITFAWIFFRANSVSDALLILRTVFTLDGITAEKAWIFNDGILGLDSQDIWMMGNTLLIFLIVEFASRKHNLISSLNRQPLWFRWPIYLALILSIVIFGYYGSATTQEFVYFRF